MINPNDISFFFKEEKKRKEKNEGLSERA